MPHETHDGPCDGNHAAISRRAFLGGSLGTFLSSLILPRLDVFAAGESRARAKSIVVVWLAGGPSQIDSFDPKPGTSSGGPFRAIPTALPGLSVSEHLPRFAEIADRVAVVRSITSNEGNHPRAKYYLQTGYKPVGPVRHPAFGAIVSEQIGPRDGVLPAFVTIGNGFGGAGFLGPEHAPFLVKSAGLPIENLDPPEGLPAERLDRRKRVLEAIRSGEFAAGRDPIQVDGHRAVREKARGLVRSPESKVFDLSEEPQSLRDAYGWSDVGQGCLLARRLVEKGVPCVEVWQNGWDTHDDNFTRTRRLLKQFDPAFSMLVADLEARSLLDTTLVVAMGEFGRTPRINERDGRDHHPGAFSVVLAGGGIRRGVVLGATDPNGEKVLSEPVSVPELIATFCDRLGIDSEFAYPTPLGRPVKIVDGGGNPVQKLIAEGF